MATFGLGAGNLVEVKTVNGLGTANPLQTIFTIPAGHYARVGRIYEETGGIGGVSFNLYNADTNSFSNFNIPKTAEGAPTIQKVGLNLLDENGYDPLIDFNSDVFFLDEGEGINYFSTSSGGRVRVLLLIYKKP